MKVVLDSNIFVSSFFWRGNPRKVFDRVINGQDELFITEEILEEIMTVLSRKKFDLSKKEIADYVNIIESFAIKIICNEKAEDVSRDKNDNKILQCGQTGNVDYIITGDDDLLVLKKYRNIKIINPKEYLDIIESR
jgi:putative PIN family toxin of toxin-antitoxin system